LKIKLKINHAAGEGIKSPARPCRFRDHGRGGEDVMVGVEYWLRPDAVVRHGATDAERA
jgi:hypothetical protein